MLSLKPSPTLQGRARIKSGLLLGAALTACIFGPVPTVQAQKNVNYVFAYAIGGSPLGQPTAITLDSAGNMFVVDTTNHRIQKFNASGFLVGTIGGNGPNSGGYGVGDLQFYKPQGITSDAAGNIYVSDTYNHRIQKIDATGKLVWKIGSQGAGNGQFTYPAGIAVDATGQVIVADRGNNRLEIFKSDGTFVKAIGTSGSGDFQFNAPYGIVVDKSGNIFVADSGNNRVVKIASTGASAGSIGGYGTANGLFSAPYGVSLDSLGNLYVVDTNNSRIQKFDATGKFVAAVGKLGAGDGDLYYPQSVAIDKSGNLFVADTSNKRIQKIDATGKFVWQVGAISADGGSFYNPNHVAVDSKGYLYVADVMNNRIQWFDATGKLLGKIGDSLGNGNYQFNWPRGIAVDKTGNIYVADTNNNRIQKYNNLGQYLATIGIASNLSAPRGLAFDSVGNLYVADTNNNRVAIFDPKGNYLKQLIGGPASADAFTSPRGVAVDATDNLYVADSDSARIQKFDKTGKWLLKFGSIGNADGQFNQPTGISFDAVGNVLIAEYNNNRVQKFDPNGNFITKITSNGPGTVGDGSAAAQFNKVFGIALATSGKLFLSETTNNRISVFSSVIPPNPLPTLTSITPTTIPVGSPITGLTTTGSNFVDASRIYFGTSALATTFVSATKLGADIPASLLATAGTFNITVKSPTPGGGTSAPVVLTVTNPVPELTTIAPTAVVYGAPQTTLTVTGAKFVKGSVVKFGQQPLVTTYVSATKLTAVVPATMLTTPATYDVTVNNIAPGGGTTKAVTFTVGNPLPKLTTVAPNSAPVASKDTKITLTGTDFQKTSVVNFGTTALVTTYVSPTQLTAVVPTALLATAAVNDISVLTPAPGGGTTTKLPFAVNNPAAVLTSLAPAKATELALATTVVVTGSGFVKGAVVTFAGTPLVTTFSSSTRLSAVIPANLLATTGNFDVVVSNPTPNLGASKSLPFVVAIGTTSLGIVTVPAPIVTVSGTNLLVAVKIKNSGKYAARNIVVTTGKLGTTSSTAISPATGFTIAAGATETVTLTFPASAAPKGSAPVVTLSYTSTNAGAKSFSATCAKVP